MVTMGCVLGAGLGMEVEVYRKRAAMTAIADANVTSNGRRLDMYAVPFSSRSGCCGCWAFLVNKYSIVAMERIDISPFIQSSSLECGWYCWSI